MTAQNMINCHYGISFVNNDPHNCNRRQFVFVMDDIGVS